MDVTVHDALYLEERRRRLAAERTLEHTRRELVPAQSALAANADRLSRTCVAERELSLRLADRRRVALAALRRAAGRADHARRWLWNAVGTIRDGFALFDSGGYLVAANHVYLDLFDGIRVSGPGDHIREIYDHAVAEGVIDTGDVDPDAWIVRQVARWDRSDPPPLTVSYRDGRTFRIEDRHVLDGDILSVAIDVTEHRTREMSLRAARDAAESAARTRAQFLTRMGHEIRTPMSGVLGMAQVLAEQATDAETRLSALTICNSAEALLGIVDDALDVSRLAGGDVALADAPFDLEALLRDAVCMAMANAGPDVTLWSTYPLGACSRFRGDVDRLRQVVSHLLGNAVRFTERGHVILRVVVTEDDPARVVVQVEDTGPGIASQDQDGIFEAFAQTPDPDRPAREGTGLGLTIARGLVELMGGTLTLRSEPETGSTFTLALPLACDEPVAEMPVLPESVAIPEGPFGDLLAAQFADCGVGVERRMTPETMRAILPLGADISAQRAWLDALPPQARLALVGRRADALPEALSRADIHLPVPVRMAELAAALLIEEPPALPAQDSPGPSAGASARILVADDNATNRLITERMLQREGYDLDVVCDGKEAISAFGARTPDVVILDISMPGVDGFEAAAAIRATGSLVPILALTAHVGDEIADRLAEAGFDAYLTKPLRKAELLAELARHLKAG